MPIFNLSWSHTFSFSDDQKYLRCSFETCPSKKGRRWSVHEGKLLGTFAGNPKAVVKVFHGVRSNSNPEKEAKAEVKKAKFVMQVLKQCPSWVKARVKVVGTYWTRVDKVGKGGKLWMKTRRTVSDDDPVVVQKFVAGHMQQLYSLDLGDHTSSSSSPGCRTSYPGMGGQTSLAGPSNLSVFQKLVEMSYILSEGQSVIGEIQCTTEQDPNGNGVQYHLTSLTVHSRSGEYGEKDKGQRAVEKYEQSRGWTQAPLPASAPPMDQGVFFAGDERDFISPSSSSSFPPSSPFSIPCSRAGRDPRVPQSQPAPYRCNDNMIMYPQPLSQPPPYRSIDNVSMWSSPQSQPPSYRSNDNMFTYPQPQSQPPSYRSNDNMFTYPQPHAQPPSYRSNDNMFTYSQPWSQPPSYEFYQRLPSDSSPLPLSGPGCLIHPLKSFPASSPVDCVDAAGSGGEGSDRPRVGRGSWGAIRRQTHEDLLATAPELRSLCPESVVNSIRGLEFTCSF